MAFGSYNGARKDDAGNLHCRVCDKSPTVKMFIGNLETMIGRYVESGLCDRCLKSQEKLSGF